MIQQSYFWAYTLLSHKKLKNAICSNMAATTVK